MAASKNSLRITAFQQAMHPTALRHARPAPQQDALALHTQAEHHIHPDATQLYGVAYDERLGDTLRVSSLFTGISHAYPIIPT